MRLCPSCGEYTAQSDSVCHNCLYEDPGWVQHQSSVNHNFKRHIDSRKEIHNKRSERMGLMTPSVDLFSINVVELPKILVSPFSDSGELGFHLENVNQAQKKYTNTIIRTTLDFTEWAYTWDYGDETDPNLSVYLPPNLPLPAIVETARFIRVLLSNEDIDLHIVMPSSRHAVTPFLLTSGIFSGISTSSITFVNKPYSNSKSPSCDTVLVPLTYVGNLTGGQLSNDFHERFNQLLNEGIVLPKYRSPLRDVIMEAAANADQYGGGGWVTAFLRQEHIGRGNFGHVFTKVSPIAETHLYLHTFTIGPTLAQTTGYSVEWEAAKAVMKGFTSRKPNGGLGMPRIIETITKETNGSVFIRSGGYTLLVTPDGLLREFYSTGSLYMPGVHLCAVVPLAYISNYQITSEFEIV